ncbi:hypothetical protein GCM10027299_21540 [Larkinella ripae]
MIGTALYSILSGATPVAQKVGNHIYPGLVPQNAPTTAIWYATDDVQPLECRTPGGSFMGFFEIGAISPNYDTLMQIIKAIRAALDNYNGVAGGFSLRTFSGVEQPDGYDDNLKLYEKSLRFKTIGQQVTQ